MMPLTAIIRNVTKKRSVYPKICRPFFACLLRNKYAGYPKTMAPVVAAEKTKRSNMSDMEKNMFGEICGYMARTFINRLTRETYTTTPSACKNPIKAG